MDACERTGTGAKVATHESESSRLLSGARYKTDGLTRCCRALNASCVNQWFLPIRWERMKTMTLGELKAHLEKNESEDRPAIR